MAEEAYERLADALNALAGGYPRTESCIEIRLLKKVFTPEQVQVGSVMSRKHETPAEIAKKAGLPEERVQQLLDEMVALNLARQFIDNGVTTYRLGPFVLGWYERHLARIDKEFAEMFEQYMAEGGAARILGPQPGIMNVVPVRGSVRPELLEPQVGVGQLVGREIPPLRVLLYLHLDQIGVVFVVHDAYLDRLPSEPSRCLRPAVTGNEFVVPVDDDRVDEPVPRQAVHERGQIAEIAADALAYDDPVDFHLHGVRGR